MRELMVFLLVLSVCLSLQAASADDWVIEVADPPANVQRGFGWIQPERNENFSFVWINHLEADIWVTLDSASATEIEIKAVPFYLNDRRQRMGLYVNNRFVEEWVCHHHSSWMLDSYTARIPEGLLKSGKNRITLRMGYCATYKGNDYALAVNSITLR